MTMSQNAFRVTKPAAVPSGRPSSPPRIIRRNRQALSCLECRSRKLKCDRQSPCSTCTRKGHGGSCTYSDGVPAPRTGQNAPMYRAGGSAKGSEAQQRLQKLEAIVANLVQEQAESPGQSQTVSNDSTAAAAAGDADNGLSGDRCPIGRLDINGSEMSYIGATHWASVLEDIRGVQDLLEDGSQTNGDTPSSTTSTNLTVPSVASSRVSDLAFSMIAQRSSEELRGYVPPKPTVDAMLSLFFNARHFQIPFLHRQKFQREYDEYWIDPSRVSLIWISILFSILHLSQQLQKLAGNTTFGDAAETQYMEKAKEALILGNYSAGPPYSVEASLIIAMWIYYERKNRETDGWIIMGVCARLAMKQGYHRDPSVLKRLSPFEGEMRRRAFFFIETFDILLSMQGGLPPLVNQDECDTQAPSNLVDADFDEDSTHLPPSRPETDHTPMLYFRYKSRLSKVFRKIYRRVLTLGRFEYDGVMELDQQIRAIRDGIPASLKFRTLAASITDDSYTIVSRNHCEQMYLKGLCILHRYFLTHERNDSQYDHSRATCINAALDMLDIQADLYSATTSHGQFSQDKWMMTQITLHDFLLVTMILCVKLRQLSEDHGSKGSDNVLEEKIYNALKRARGIWSSQLHTCDEAVRASKVLNAVLDQTPPPLDRHGDGNEGSTPQGLPTPTRTPNAEYNPNPNLPYPAAAQTSWGLEQGMSAQPESVEATAFDPIASFDAFAGVNDGLDWSSIDQFVFQGMDLTPEFDL